MRVDPLGPFDPNPRVGTELERPRRGEHPIAPAAYPVFICIMRNTSADTALPETTSDADDIRVDIDRLESEAPTHDGRRDADEAHQRFVLRKVAQGDSHENDRGFVD